jgi:hypothetical protein
MTWAFLAIALSQQPHLPPIVVFRAHGREIAYVSGEGDCYFVESDGDWRVPAETCWRLFQSFREGDAE